MISLVINSFVISTVIAQSFFDEADEFFIEFNATEPVSAEFFGDDEFGSSEYDSVTCDAPILPPGVDFDIVVGSLPFQVEDAILYSCINSNQVLADNFLTYGVCDANGGWGEVPTCINKYCIETTVQSPFGFEITFPKTQAGYTNYSVDKCPPNTSYAGTPLASMTCLDSNGRTAWFDPPVWLSSCNKSLQDIASTNITDDKTKSEVASDLSILTSNVLSLTSEDISLSSTILESIISTQALHRNTADLVVRTVGNLLATPAETLAESSSSQSLLATLDQTASIVTLSENGDYQTFTSTVAVACISVKNKKADFKQVGFQEDYNPYDTTEGFRIGQFKTFISDNPQENSSYVIIPSEAINKTQDRVSFFAFSDDKVFRVSQRSDCSNPAAISSSASVQSTLVLSASITAKKVQNLTDKVKLNFKYKKTSCGSESDEDLINCGSYVCGFWDESGSAWSSKGCTLTGISMDIIKCECDHLTNFATLFAYGETENIRNNFVLDLLTIIGCGVSLLGSVATILALIVLRCSTGNSAKSNRKVTIANRTLFVMINMALAIAFLNSFLLLSFSDYITQHSAACTAFAVALHFSLFSAMLWTTVEAVYVGIGVVKPIYYKTQLTSKKVYLSSLLLGWGLPSFFVAVSAGISISSYTRNTDDCMSKICWIVPEMMIYLVVIPASIVLFFNTSVYVIVVTKFLCRKKVGSSNVETPTGKVLAFSASLFLLFGITWIFGFILFDSSNALSLLFAYIFTVTNSVQGLILFALFVVRNKQIRLALKDKIEDLNMKAAKQCRTPYMPASKSESERLMEKTRSHII